MSTVPPSAEALSVPVDPRANPVAATPVVDERLTYLFRAALKSGRVHPLYLPILRYRQTRDDA